MKRSRVLCWQRSSRCCQCSPSIYNIALSCRRMFATELPGYLNLSSPCRHEVLCRNAPDTQQVVTRIHTSFAFAWEGDETPQKRIGGALADPRLETKVFNHKLHLAATYVNMIEHRAAIIGAVAETGPNHFQIAEGKLYELGDLGISIVSEGLASLLVALKDHSFSRLQKAVDLLIPK